MKSILPAILFLTMLLVPGKTWAQCTAPGGAAVISMPAYCLGEGKVIVDTVTGGAPADVYQYQLQFDSTSNTSIVKPWQAADTFNQVARGRYKVYIRKVCNPGPGFSASFVSSSITVGGTTTPVAIQQVTKLTKSSCTNGSFSVTASGGNTNAAYQYALVPSLNAAEPVVTYVQPRQAGNTFKDLAAGTYYVRVYDTCGTYASANVVIDSVTESAMISSLRDDYIFYGCDSLRFMYRITINNKLQSGPPDPKERFWITYNGVTDTVGLLGTYTYSSVTGISSATAVKMFRNIPYPVTISYGYKSACGNIYQQSVSILKPNLKLTLSNNSISCTSQRFSILTRDSTSSNYNYYNTRLSLDSGANWSALNNNNSYADTFIVGRTYSIWVASACDTEKIQVTTTVPALNFQLNLFTAYSCNNQSGFNLSFLGNGYSGKADSVFFEVINQPAGGTLPGTFYMRDMTFSNGSTSGYRLSYNMPPGTYTLKATDQCGATVTRSITIAPTIVAYTIAPVFSCVAAQSGFRLNVTETNYNPYAGYSYLRAIVRNTATNQVDSFQSASNLSRPTTIDVIGLSPGQYAIHVIKVRPNSLPYPACGTDSTYTSHAGQPLSIGQATFTAACANNTATVAVQASGGSNSYQYTLDIQGAGGWNTVSGPAASGIFNNLLPGSVYRVRVNDTCGNGTSYSTSFNTAPPNLSYSGTRSPCPGDSFTIYVNQSPGAVYQWYRNNAALPSSNSSSYTVNPVPIAAIDTYYVKTTIGNCDLFSNAYVLNPVNCNKPLPLSLLSYTAVLKDGKAQLQWESATHQQGGHYEVEFSSNGITFLKVGEVTEKEGATNYRFSDIERHTSSMFYRLKMIRNNEDALYSIVLRLNAWNRGTESAIRIYPTVVSDKINLDYSIAEESQLHWKIVTTQGTVLRSGIFHTGNSISSFTIEDLSVLQDGTYILYLSNNANIFLSKLFLLVH